MNTALTCRICGSSQVLARHVVAEMMHGTGEQFAYFQCADCLCLQIENIPANLAMYYQGGYYSYRRATSARNPVKRWAAYLRDRQAVFGGSLLGAWLERLSPVVELRALKPLKLQRTSRVLDVGCGAGELVFRLANQGVVAASGVDPFIPEEIAYSNGVRIRKCELREMRGEWDVIMFHHSFEHLPDPASVLRDVWDLLPVGGRCLLRVPTVTSFAWKHYGVDWVQLDAPRHLHLFAHESIAALAKATGFDLESIVHDGTDFQFWGSEQYRRGVPLLDARSHSRQPGVQFTAIQIAEFKRRSAELNQASQGDQAAFYLRKRAAPLR